MEVANRLIGNKANTADDAFIEETINLNINPESGEVFCPTRAEFEYDVTKTTMYTTSEDYYAFQLTTESQSGQVFIDEKSCVAKVTEKVKYLTSYGFVFSTIKSWEPPYPGVALAAKQLFVGCLGKFGTDTIYYRIWGVKRKINTRAALGMMLSHVTTY